MKDISANSIDLIICDLPYGVLASQNINKNINCMRNGIVTGPKAQTKNGLLSGCAWDVKIDLAKFWEQAKRILKNEHCPVIHFCTTKFGYELIKSNESWFRYDLVWDKQRGVSFLSANKMPMRSHEMIYVFSKAGAYYNRVDIKGDFKGWVAKDISGNLNLRASAGNIKNWKANENKGTRCVLSVLNGLEKKSHGKDTHPTEKPVCLYRWLIERYSPPDGTVLDPTFGSGNSVFTAWEMGRNAIGIEKDDGFYDKAEKKLNTIE
jgi:site-specific DNA-methyltransferase (adenine-specific)